MVRSPLCWRYGPFRCAHVVRLRKEIHTSRAGDLFSCGRADGEVAHRAARRSAAATPPRTPRRGRKNLVATLIDAANDLDVGCTVVHVRPHLPGGWAGSRALIAF